METDGYKQKCEDCLSVWMHLDDYCPECGSPNTYEFHLIECECIECKKLRKMKPQKTITAYKLFRILKNRPSEIFPLFIDKNNPVPINKWIEAKFIPTKNYSKRPGWHVGRLPIAPHLMKKNGTLADNRVWAKVEISADVDWQP